MNTTGIGGTETFTLQLADYIQKHQSNSILINLAKSELLKRESKKSSIVYFDLPSNYILKLVKIIAIVRQSKCEIVMGYGVNVSLALSLVRMFYPRRMIIIGLRGLTSWRNRTQIKLLNLTEKYSCNLFIANCRAVLDNKLSVSPAIIERGMVINNGIDTAHFRNIEGGENNFIKSRDILVVTVANLLPVKGYLFLLEALNKHDCERYNLKFIWIGRGPQKKILENIICDKGLSGIIEIRGYSRSIKKELQMADIFILPSIMEGLSRALLEAMSMSLPCIATRVGGNADVIDNGVSGFLVNYGDQEDLQKRIIELAKNKKLREDIGKSARNKVVKEHSEKEMAHKYYELFKNLASN